MTPDMGTGFLLLAMVGALAYLLGSIPFGLVSARAFGLADPRSIGSHNIGATNVLRMGNRWAAAITLVGDAGKGAAAVLLARWLVAADAAQLAGFAAFLGHCFPVYIGFRGGKGVATFLGTLLALGWPLGIAACLVWLAVAKATRYSSLAALMAAGLSAPMAWLVGRPELAAICVALALVVFYRHSGNIRRLIARTEPKIGDRDTRPS